MKKLTLALLAALAACQARTPKTEAPPPAPAPTTLATRPLLAEAPPESVGMAPNRLVRIDSLMTRELAAGHFPGMVALVARRGKIVLHRSWGKKNLATGAALTNSDVFRIMSMTKAVTSVAVMMLYEEGKIMLDDPLSKYLPEWKNPKVLQQLILTRRDTSFRARPAKREPTVRHLLTHTAGITYGHPLYKKAGIPDFHSQADLTLDRSMVQLARLPLLHEPGEKFTYGLNTDLLGHLVERVSGLSLSEFFARRIFRPLGMTDTHFYLPDNQADRLVELYEEVNDSLLAHRNRPFADYPVQGAKKYYSGGAGLSSTALDYARFLQMLLNGGEYNGTQLLSRTTIALMTTNQIGDLEVWDRRNKFGLGFELTVEAARPHHPLSLGSYEWGGMYCTHFWVDPQEQLIGVLFTNVWPTTHWNIGEQFKNLTYQAIVE